MITRLIDSLHSNQLGILEGTAVQAQGCYQIDC